MTKPNPYATPVSIARRCLDLINRGLAHLNLKLDTCTAARTELARLQAAEARGWFTQAIFPVPGSFLAADSRIVFDALPAFKERFDSFHRTSDNEVGYHFDNPFFSSPDTEVLYTLVRHFRPQRVLEIGCGNSTRITRQAIKDGTIACSLACIDPQPREEICALADEFIRQPIETQNASQLAGSLGPGDLLFIDTSHEVRVANDVAFIYGDILPRVRPGVVVHIHDIFTPYAYPRDWVFHLDGNTWGEQDIVQALLAGNDHWKVIWPGHYLQRTISDFARHFPHLSNGMAQSLWMQKL